MKQARIAIGFDGTPQPDVRFAAAPMGIRERPADMPLVIPRARDDRTLAIRDGRYPPLIELGALEYLNLVGTKVTDAAMPTEPGGTRSVQRLAVTLR